MSQTGRSRIRVPMSLCTCSFMQVQSTTTANASINQTRMRRHSHETCNWYSRWRAPSSWMWRSVVWWSLPAIRRNVVPPSSGWKSKLEEQAIACCLLLVWRLFALKMTVAYFCETAVCFYYNTWRQIIGNGMHYCQCLSASHPTRFTRFVKK
jgi:hypothetical protein